MKKEIYFIRHGQTDYNLKGLVQGSGIDTHLNQTGIEQGRAFFEFYQNEKFDIVYTSHLKRSIETVQAFIDQKIPHIIDENIREISWGIYEGQSTKDWDRKKYDLLISEWDKGNYEARLEKGESGIELATRVKQFLNRIENSVETKILVCTHGRTLRCIISLLQNLELKAMENVHHHNTGLYKVIYECGKYELITQNDTKHLKSIEI